MSFESLIREVRTAVGSRAPILHLPPGVLAVVSRALGLFVRDVVLTADEINGLMAGLLTSTDPPLGRIAFSEWLARQSGSLGRTYANELKRHFSPPAAA
jgi:NADH dehydrogenase